MQNLDTFFVAHEETAYKNFPKATKSEPKLNLTNAASFLKTRYGNFRGTLK